jgi:hypothetical protein
MDEDKKSEGSWWRTFPGMLTAAAGTITALTGLIVALQQSGLIGGGDRPPQPAKTEARPDASAPSPTSLQSSPAPGGTVVAASAPAKPNAAPRPWSESDVVITSIDGVATVVNAESLGNCISTSKELTLSSGQSITFEKMRAFEFTRDTVKPTLTITLLNGKSVQGSMSMGCEIVGNNDLGRFNLPYEKVKRVEFNR